MPCYRCGARQVDPDRGPSPWKRGVRSDRQVLVCPQCQSGRDWASDLDRCRNCGTVHLVRRLGEVECRDCGQVRQPADGPAGADTSGVAAAAGAASGRAAGESPAAEVGADSAARGDAAAGGDSAAGEAAAGLAEEVARALDRVLGPHRVSR
jgi:hypothetical protein